MPERSTSGVLLAPLAWLYGGVVAWRNGRFERQPSLVHKLAVPVISVGNLTTGGTGKTPTVIEIARRLQRLSRRPAILTRGYGAARGQDADEVLEMREAMPGVTIAPNPDRLAAGASVLNRAEADCFVLDDGFQHRQLARDLDIVLIDTLRPWGGGRLLPAGRLREQPESLERADVVLLTRSNQVSRDVLGVLESQVRALAGDALVLRSRVEADALTWAEADSGDPGCGDAGSAGGLSRLARRSVQPVCGLGNPETFERLVRPLAGRAAPVLRFRDHHRYGLQDVAAICAAARRHDAECVITTGKDWPKLAPLWRAAPRALTDGLALGRLQVRTVIDDARDQLGRCLRRSIGQG